MSRPESGAKRARESSAPLSVVLGALLVPLAAGASMLLVGPAAGSVQPAPSVEGAVGLQHDLIAACGPAADDLIALERTGSVSELQRAALEALRPICAGAGMSLPVAPEVGAETVSAPAPSPSAPAAPAAVTADDDRDDDWDDDRDDDDRDDDDDDRDDDRDDDGDDDDRDDDDDDDPDDD